MSNNSNSQNLSKEIGFFADTINDAKFVVACLILKIRLMQKDNPLYKNFKKACKKQKKSKLTNQQVLDIYLKLSFKDLVSCKHKRFLQWIDNSNIFDFVIPVAGVGAAAFMLYVAAGAINEHLLLGLLDFIPGAEVIGFSVFSMVVLSAAVMFSECARSNPGATGIHDYLKELESYPIPPFLACSRLEDDEEPSTKPQSSSEQMQDPQYS